MATSRKIEFDKEFGVYETYKGFKWKFTINFIFYIAPGESTLNCIKTKNKEMFFKFIDAKELNGEIKQYYQIDWKLNDFMQTPIFCENEMLLNRKITNLKKMNAEYKVTELTPDNYKMLKEFLGMLDR